MMETKQETSIIVERYGNMSKGSDGKVVEEKPEKSSFQEYVDNLFGK